MAVRTLTIPVRPSRTRWLAARRLLHNRLSVLGLVLVGLIVVAGIGAPYLALHDPAAQTLSDRRALPSSRYLLGADEFGRDILSRILFGSRLALLVGVGSVAIGMTLGMLVGGGAAITGGWPDDVFMRSMDILLAFPYLMLALVVVTVLGPGPVNTTIAVGLWAVPAFARMTRGAVLTVLDQEYVEAARAVGASGVRIAFTHILPNGLPPVLVLATLYMGYAILLESALSFLGLGVQPPTPSWGLMISTGREYLFEAPHVSTFPGLAITLAVLGFNLVGDGLRDALDPKAAALSR
ncbi:MAG: ABC transporter permease [Armatimonadetes bacterium]|nr:ABC transporter permease [Armatimonadota bacterium]